MVEQTSSFNLTCVFSIFYNEEKVFSRLIVTLFITSFRNAKTVNFSQDCQLLDEDVTSSNKKGPTFFVECLIDSS